MPNFELRSNFIEGRVEIYDVIPFATSGSIALYASRRGRRDEEIIVVGGGRGGGGGGIVLAVVVSVDARRRRRSRRRHDNNNNMKKSRGRGASRSYKSYTPLH